MRLIVEADAAQAASRAATEMLAVIDGSVAERGAASVALSGGTTTPPMLVELARRPAPWDRVSVFQVDERVAPRDDAARNLTAIEGHLGTLGCRVVPMEVEDNDLEAAAARYADGLPAQLDLVHLGLGPDGHTASLVPGDAVLEAVGAVATTGTYQAHRRMTLTFATIDGARSRLFLVVGAEKRDALTRLLAGDHSIPAGRVTPGATVVVCDTAAAPERTR